MKVKIQILPLVLCFLTRVTSQVIELDERFIERSKEGLWLVEFYAPWCGHCKKLEPIYHQVSLLLKDSPVRVAKLDCTRFSNVASHFDVRGFPTIKFFNGDNVYTHRGERSSEDILEFVRKAQGPVVRKLASIGKFNEARSEHFGGVFFLYIGDEDPNDDLYRKFSSISERLAVVSYFYSGKESILPKEEVKLKNYPTVIVLKDGTWYEYEDNIPSMSSLEKWIDSERYPAFPKVAGGNINEMAEVGKSLVMVVLNEHDTEKKTLNERLKDICKILAVEHRQRFHSDYQFLWMDDTETVNSITMSFLAAPVIVVLNPQNHYYYFPTFGVKDVTIETMSEFLTSIKKGKLQAHGGTGFLQRLKRIFYDVFVTVLSVWESSRWLFLLMFGLPTCVVSVVCYSLCCMEPMDDAVGDSEDEDEYDNDAVDDRESKREKEVEPMRDPYHEKAD